MTTPPLFVANTVLSAAQMNKIGMWKISTTSLSGVTTNISNCFSGDYTNYRVICQNLNGGGATTRLLTLRFRTTSDDTTASYNGGTFGTYGAGTTTQFAFGGATSATLAALGAQPSGSAAGGFVLDIMSPNVASGTTYTGSGIMYQPDLVSYVSRSFSGNMTTATQYTGFSIIGVTDSLVGTIQVYGYN